MSERKWTATLKGIGPAVPLSEIEVTAKRHEFRREIDRYDWMARQVSQEALRPLSAYLEPLRENHVRVPGSVEVSMVALSLHPDPLARVALADYKPPEDLYLLHLVCLEACRG